MESNNMKYSTSKFHSRFSSDMQKSETTTTSVRNGHSLRKTSNSSNKIDEKFFFSNMLRSLLHKNRVLSGRKCRTEMSGLNRKTLEPKREVIEKISMGMINVPDKSFSYFDFGDTNFWYPSGFPWNYWPEVPPPLTTKLYEAALPSSSTSFSKDNTNVGRLFRDVPMGELWLRQPQPNFKLPVMQTEASFCKMDKRLGLFKRDKLSCVHKFRPHLLSAFSVPNPRRVSVHGCEPKIRTSQSNVHYVVRNLRSIFSTDVHGVPPKDAMGTSSVTDHTPSPLLSSPSSANETQCQESDRVNKDTQTSPQLSTDCRQFSALIGLEIVVDYVQKTA